MSVTHSPKPLKIASKSKLLQTWHASKDAEGKGGAPGVDGQTPRSFKDKLEINIATTHYQLMVGGYEFSKLRPIPVSKPNGKVRIICVPTVRDRLVQRLAVDYLNENDKLGIRNEASYGFVSGRGGVGEAVKKAQRWRNEYPWVFKSDIQAFFDEINREELRKDLAKTNLRNSSILPIIYSAINCEIDLTEKRFKKYADQATLQTGLGLRQGMPLSPILSNFVLADFDRAFEKLGARLIRYADDFVIFAENKEKCESFFPIARDILKKKKHTIPDPGVNSKTIICPPDQPIEFLGFEITRKPSGNRYDIMVPKKAFDKIKEEIKSFSNFEDSLKEYKTLARVTREISNLTSGFLGVYRFARNFPALEAHVAQCRAQAFKDLLKTIFSEDVIGRLDKSRKLFLELDEFI